MKKAIAFVTVLMLAASMAACGSDGAGSASSGSSKEESKTESKSESSGSTGTSSSGSSEEKQTGDGTVYNIGICQLVQHEALDAATQGFKDALVEKLGKDNVKFDEQNASGDSATCATMASAWHCCPTRADRCPRRSPCFPCPWASACPAMGFPNLQT